MTDINTTVSNQPQGNPGEGTTPPSSNDTSVFGEYATKAGLGTKFKDTEDLAKGKVHADAYIEELKSKLAATEAQLAASKNAQEVLEEIKQLRTMKADTPASNGDVDINTLIEQKLSQRAQEQVTVENKALADKALREKFGSEAKAQLEKTAKDLGVSPSFLIDVAAQSPKAFMAYFDSVPGNTPPVGSTGGSINTIALGNSKITDPLSKLKADTEALGIDRKKNPEAYFKAINSQLT
jgi:hypothetical protein